jgi:hypothetical protein
MTSETEGQVGDPKQNDVRDFEATFDAAVSSLSRFSLVLALTKLE